MPEELTHAQLKERISRLEAQLAQCRREQNTDPEADLFVKLERFRLAFYTSPDAINISRLTDGSYIDINEGFTKLTGYTKADLLANPSLRKDIWKNPQDRKHFIQQLQESGRVTNFEACFVTKDGSLKYGLMSARILEMNNEMVMLSIARDITERKIMEQEREQIQQRLILAQRLESIGTLAGGVAHDFNNLLMGIQGRASVMFHELDSDHPCIEHVNAILEYSRNATHLTKQLLGIARGGKYEIKPVDLNELLRNSAAIFGRTKKEIRIHTKLHTPAPIVAVDPQQIEQVLLNLYVNAWQAMPSGGDMYLQTDLVVLDDNFCKPHRIEPGTYAKGSVIDTGIGMDPKILPRIFDPFFTTKEKIRGTGLGLASAYGIIKNHDGLINVTSALGQGTTFDIYLPISDKKVTRESQPRSGFDMGQERILLVDDESMVLDVGKIMLQKMGYHVMTAQSGQAATQLLESSETAPDLVILDLIMPDMSGAKTFEAIRNRHPNLPIILASGYSIDSQAREIMAKGCNGFIQKPFNMEQISIKIREVLSTEKKGDL